jgi:hypothetical protein
MNWLTGALAGMGLPSALAARAAPWVGLALVCALLWLLWGISAPIRAAADWFDDREAVQDDRRRANLERLNEQAKADAKAAEQRVADVVAQIEQEQDFADAINNPQPGDSDDPNVRLGCERLRRSGQDTSGIPACGGR